MKILLSIMMLLMLTLCATGPGAATDSGGKARQIEFDKNTFALEKALEDIAANMDLIISMRHAFGESSHLEWGIPVAEKLPSQPVAVIRLIARSGVAVDAICPRVVIEDAIPFDEYIRGMERSVASLQAFTMNDPKEERVRKACLAEIRKALATKEQWRY